MQKAALWVKILLPEKKVMIKDQDPGDSGLYTQDTFI